MIKRKPRRIIKKIKIYNKCLFCEGKIGPDYKEVETLKKLVTERGKIVSREYSSVCSRHQRNLTKEVKRARYLALLPFVNQIG